MSQLPFDLDPSLAARLRLALDQEGKIARALDALAPVADRDVVVVDGERSLVVETLDGLGARVTHVPLAQPQRLPVADSSADIVIGLWSSFRGAARADLVEVDRALRPEGRHLVVLDYGRDDVSRILGARPEYGEWSQRGGPFLGGGFRVRVLHCWWTFDSLEDMTAFLVEAFGDAGAAVGAGLKRPRLSYNVAIYHRTRTGDTAP